MPTHEHATHRSKGERATRLARALLSLSILAALGWLGARAVVRVAPPPRVPAQAPSAEVVLASAPAPSHGSPVGPERTPPCGDLDRVSGAILPDGRVVLNLAGVRDLMELPGIGEKRARAIAALRARQGRFRSLRDLLRVRGIGPKALRRIEPKVVLEPPEPSPGSPRAASPARPEAKGA
ncbi:MAG: helix-hairpin-helix domain-containing protein [Deltaproteobacteria bacterium]|nr:helix-hairpin-helix domain-containing protein [Deltaproteobacteria bacterium]